MPLRFFIVENDRILTITITIDVSFCEYWTSLTDCNFENLSNMYIYIYCIYHDNSYESKDIQIDLTGCQNRDL